MSIHDKQRRVHQGGEAVKEVTITALTVGLEGRFAQTTTHGQNPNSFFAPELYRIKQVSN